MSFIGDLFRAVGSIFGGGGGGQPAQIIQPMQPTPAPPPPDRSDSDIQREKERQRRKYSGGGPATNMLTSGSGVSSDATYGATTALLGGG